MISANLKHILKQRTRNFATTLPSNNNQLLRFFSFSTASAQPSNAHTHPFDLPSLPYEIIFPETSKSRVQSFGGSASTTTPPPTITDIESHIKHLVKLASDEISVSTSSSNSNTQSSESELSYTSLKRKDPKYQVARIETLSKSSWNLTKNATPALIDSLIQLLDAYKSLPQSARPSFARQIQLCLKHIFYTDFQGSLEFEKIRKILFISVKHNFAIPIPLVTLYFSFIESTTTNNTSTTIPRQLRFDNLIDIIITLHLMKVHHSAINQITQIESEAVTQLSHLLDAVLAKKFELRFPQFLALFNAVVQLTTTEALNPQIARITDLSAVTDKMTLLVQQIFYQISSAESKVEIVVLLTMLNKPDIVDFLLPHLQNQIKSNLDMLELSDEQLQLICQYISRIKANHPKFHNFITSVLVEQEDKISTKCLSNLLNIQNQISLDVPYALKNTLIKIISNDHLMPQSQLKGSNSVAIHPTLRYNLGLQQKLGVITKLIGSVHISDSLFTDLIHDFQAYDSDILTEELGFTGIYQAIHTCNKLRMADSLLFERFETHICELIERLRFDTKQMQQVLSILNSYASSTHKLSKRFIEGSLEFLINALPRISPKYHGAVYMYLGQILMRSAEGDFKGSFDVNTLANEGIRRLLDILISDHKEVLNSIEKLETNPAFAVHQLFAVIHELREDDATGLLGDQAQKLSDAVLSPNWVKKCSILFNIHSQAEVYLLNQIHESLKQRFETMSISKDARIAIYQCDLLFEDIKLLVNLNGPTQCILGSQEIIAKNRLRNFLLKSQGYQVIDVSCGDITKYTAEQKEDIINTLERKVARVAMKKAEHA